MHQTASGKAKSALIFSALVLFAAIVISTATASAATPADGGEATYKSKCAICHAPDGSGGTPTGKAMKLRDLRSADVQKQTDAQLLAIITKGKGKMPAYESLGADTTKALVAHIRALAKK